MSHFQRPQHDSELPKCNETSCWVERARPNDQLAQIESSRLSQVDRGTVVVLTLSRIGIHAPPEFAENGERDTETERVCV